MGEINKVIISDSDKCHKINEGKVFGGVIFDRDLNETRE